MINLLKTINKYLNTSIIVSVLFAILGIILIIWPKTSLETFSYIIGSVLLIYGVFNFIDSFTINPVFCLPQMTSSVLSALLGILIFLKPSLFENLLPIVLGIFFIINGSFKARMSFVLKKVDSSWILSLITSILMVVCGFILIINPNISAIMITTLIGIMLVVYAISDIIDTFVFKSRVKDISKYFEKYIK
ncbi:MAG: HdeD family acid-resistance protein [Bacilli bacterium]